MVRDTYYPYFDYLRAAAAIGVFVSHADFGHHLPENFGNACVQLFFSLSGFLIGGILFHSKQGDLPRFFFNRATRIWIPYAIAIGLLAVVTAIKQGLSGQKIHEMFFYMTTFVYNWFGPPQLAAFHDQMPLAGTGNHFWSICVEEQFYLVAPFLITVFPRPALFASLMTATLASPDYFASISLGVTLAFCGPSIWLLAACAITGLILIFTGPYIAAVSFVSVAIVCGLALLPGKQNAFGRIAGGASYPFYLNHWIGLFGINAALKIGMPYWLSWGSGLFIACGLSVAHYVVIDRTVAMHRSDLFSMRRGGICCLCGFSLVLAGAVGGLFFWR